MLKRTEEELTKTPAPRRPGTTGRVWSVAASLYFRSYAYSMSFEAQLDACKAISKLG
jgi:hypothetical protein